MKGIIYSPDYKEKIVLIKQWIRERFGKDTADKSIKAIQKRIASLKQFPEQGISVQEMFGIITEYRYIYIAPNYVFYVVGEDFIRIVNIYNEREDFSYHLFGISSVNLEFGDEESN